MVCENVVFRFSGHNSQECMFFLVCLDDKKMQGFKGRICNQNYYLVTHQQGINFSFYAF